MVVSRLIKVVSVKGLPAHLRSNISMQYRCAPPRSQKILCQARNLLRHNSQQCSWDIALRCIFHQDESKMRAAPHSPDTNTPHARWYLTYITAISDEFLDCQHTPGRAKSCAYSSRSKTRACYANLPSNMKMRWFRTNKIPILFISPHQASQNVYSMPINDLKSSVFFINPT